MHVAEIFPWPIIPRPIPPAAAAFDANDVRAALPPASLPGDPRVVVRHEGVEIAFADEAALLAEVARLSAEGGRARQAALYDAAPLWARLPFEYAAIAEYLAAVLAGLCAAVWFWSLPR